MVEEEEELLPQTSIGHYEIHRRIGSGGMGDVYAAEHTALGKRVAIKVLRRRYVTDDTVIARFIREGKLAARLRHPNIVDVTDVAVIDGLPCLVMELLEGEPLSDRVSRDGPIPEDALADLLLPVVAALDHAHSEGVLHRDLKPGNVFLARGWNDEAIAKVLDFGISKSIGETATSALTGDTGIMGTPRYVAPEIIGGEPATAKSDQYAIGLVLYEAATGVKPFAEAGTSIVALARAIVTGDTQKPRDVRPELSEECDRVIRRAMALLPQDRYPSMLELGAALLPIASPRVRTIWESVFAGAAPLEMTSETGRAVVPSELRGDVTAPSGESSLGGIAVPAAQDTVVMAKSGERRGPDPDDESRGGTLVITQPMGPPTPRSSIQPRPPPAAPITPRRADDAAARPPKLPAAALAITGVALAGVLVVAIGLARSSERSSSDAVRPSADAGAVAHAPSSAPPATYAVSLRTVPPDATIELDGVPAGVGSLSRSLPRDGARHVVRVSSSGHEMVSIAFDEAMPPPAVVTLRPLGGPAAPPNRGRPAPHGKDWPESPGGRTDNLNPWE